MEDKKARQQDRHGWTARVASLEAGNPARRRAPLSVSLVVDAALSVVSTEGYDALTIRRVAAALHVTPGALYVHVRDKAELDDLMIGRLSSQVEPPDPDPVRWKQQFLDTCRQLRDRYLAYPGIARAVFATAPDNLDSLRVTEGLLAILSAGGVPPRAAAWGVDAALLQTAAFSVVAVRRFPAASGLSVSEAASAREEMLWRFESLPAHLFPSVVFHAEDLLAGDADERFDFTLQLMLTGLGDLISSSEENRAH